MTRRVRDVMTSRVVAVPTTASLVEAAQYMRCENVGDVLVLERGELYGVVTDRDIVVRGLARRYPPTETTVAELATVEPVTVHPDASLEEADALMRRHRVRRLPVVESRRVLGVITQADIARARTSPSRRRAPRAVNRRSHAVASSVL